MARLSRLAIPGEVHHLIQRGHDQQPIVRDDEDRRAFVDALRECAALHKVAIHAYVLMDNHLHLLATPPAPESLSRMMQSLGRRYVARFNRRHQRSGGLWEGRFRAAPLEPSWLLSCMRYIELNPQRSGLVERPEAYAWSSAAHHLGAVRDPLVHDHAGFWAMGNTPFERDANYRRYLEEGSSPEEMEALLAAALRGWPLGSPAYRAQLAKQTDRPLAPRPRGRPPRQINKTVPN
ncbi:transposase [Roseateles flavus]|uniref:Transposase n=1 Tax=Roseateles flavus TaxID=3149041 RepID=A0ABV0G9Y1_9BURK